MPNSEFPNRKTLEAGKVVPPEWNETKRAYPLDRFVPMLFEEQVEKTPQATAVINQDQHLTYDQLNQRANQLAHYLRKQGLCRNTLVALCIDRSLELEVALLGILKAGAGYLPLDPTHPDERLAFILHEAEPVMILVQQHYQNKPAFAEKNVFAMETQESDLNSYGCDNPAHITQENDLAYVLYTSGSTGRPKGVMIEHRAFLNHFLWLRETLKLTPKDRVLQKTTYCFDVSLWELFGPLLAGATLVMAEPDGHKDPQYLIATIQAHNITTVYFVPSVFEILLEHPNCSGCQSLERVVCIGEALPGRVIDRFQKMFPKVALFNSYGPTETTIAVSWWDCYCYKPERRVTIGRPIANTQLYILDEQHQPVTIGAPGELYIGGMQLARGYVNRPDLTDKQFVDIPLESDSHKRLYKSGDLCRYLPDGNIEFLGRLDHQVKIRGVRIECGEIETVLTHHGSIRQAVVIAREDHRGDQRLVAYLVCSESIPITKNQVHIHLKTHLPDYMIPSTFVFVPCIPLTPNGKVDRKALPVPQQESDPMETSECQPTTATQKGVFDLFCELLGMAPVRLDANFFQLGGHSLLAVKLTYRIQAIFHVSVSITEIFQYPTIKTLSAWIDGALRQKGSQCEQESIQTTTRHDTLPLSFSQQRLWFLSELHPHSAFYNVAFRLTLSGRLDVPMLEKCFVTLLQRHAILRTNILCQDGEPVQVIHDEVDCPLSCTDMGSHKELEQRLQTDACKPFNLTHDTLIRYHLYNIATVEHALLVVMHHIVTDGTSVRLFLNELGALYNAQVKGQSVSLPPQPIRYADYARWQRHDLAGTACREQWAYWQNQLKNMMMSTELPCDFPRPQIQTYNGSMECILIDESLTQAIYALTYEYKTTPFVTLLTGLMTLLYRYTNITDLAVGSPVANRTRQDIETVLGFFVNTIVLRARLSNKLSFVELLQQMHVTCLEAQDNQAIPFEQLVNTLQVERDLSRGPLFQIMFLLIQDMDTMIRLDGLTTQYQNISTDTSKCDLSFIIEQRAAILTVKVEYNTDLYKAQTIRGVLEHYRTLLASIVADPHACMTYLPLLTERECRDNIDTWGKNPHAYPSNRCVHQLFESQTMQSPGAIALQFQEQQLAYGLLNEHANQLAHYLKKQGLAAGQCVGLLMDRCPDLIVSILAILKAGGAYVPLDRSFPKARLQRIIDETGLSVLLTHSHMDSDLLIYDVKTLVVDALESTLVDQPIHNLNTDVHADHLAYIMYTSGSTGRPKGVAIRHRGIVRLLFGIDYMDLTGEQTFLQLAPLGFDASTFEIWAPLLHGHRCVLYPEPVPDLEQLATTLQQNRVNCLWLTASLFNLIIDEKPEMLRGVSQLITGGEALSVDHVRRALAVLPDTQLINGYGPTESTTFACCYRIPRDLPDNLVSIPIGRPIANTECLILDQHQHPVPIGVPGELHIGGDGLAQGYIDQAPLTAERFIQNPYDPSGQTRLYKTGDLCRWLSNGLIEFLGRRDDQIKMRGFRIELGEINAALVTHPAIQRAVTILHQEPPNSKQLVAYGVLHADQVTPTVEQVCDHLKDTLPDYMIPAAIIWIDQIPLTVNGKVDFKALPKPAEYSVIQVSNQSPQTNTEKQLAILFQEVLRQQSIHRDSHFFRLGGHSLLAVKLFHEIQQTFNKKLPLATLFQAPTVERLARLIDGCPERVSHSSLVKLRGGSQASPLFILPGLGGHSLSFAGLAERLDIDRPIYGLELQGLDGQKEPHTSIKAMATHFVDLIRDIHEKGPYTLMGYSLGGRIAFEMACQLVEKGLAVDALVILSATAPGYPRTSKHRSIRYAYRIDDFLRLPFRRKGQYLVFKLFDLRKRLSRSCTRRIQQATQSPSQREFSEALKNVSRQAMHAWYTYAPDHPYPGDLLLIRNTVTNSPLSHNGDNPYDGWDTCVTGSIEKHNIACGHLELLDNESLKQWVPMLRYTLVNRCTAISSRL